MPGRSGDWWLVISHSHLLIPNPCFQTFSGGFAAKKEANPASLRSAAPSKGRGLRGYTLLPMEGGAPKGRRLDGESGISVSQPSPMGKAKRSRLRRPKRKPTPPRCARQPLPREGACVDTPSFLWKEVPRRGGGWMGIAVFPKQSLPRVGKVASGASRIGF